MPSPAVELRDISKRFSGQEILKNLDLQIETHELFVLLGENGSGKSTVLRLIAGLETPDSGEIFLHGESVAHRLPAERQVSLVLQSGGYYDDLTVKQNLHASRCKSPLGRSSDASRISEVIQWLELSALLDRKPNALSGGELQRLALARGLCRNANLILLDEPFSQMTATARIQNQQRLRQFQRKTKSTVIHITHDVEEAMYLADRLAVLHKGSIQQIGTPQSLFDRPNNLCVARMLCPNLNLFRASVVRCGSNLSIHIGSEAYSLDNINRFEELHEATPYQVWLAIRPDLLDLVDTESANCDPWRATHLRFRAEVIEVRYILGSWHYVCAAPDGSTFTLHQRHRISALTGDRLVVAAPFPCFQVFDASSQVRLDKSS